MPLFLLFPSGESAFANPAPQSPGQTATQDTATSSPTAATPLARQIAALLAEPAARRAHWGIAVTTLDGRPLYTLNADQLFRPASTAKLFTTAAAITLLGPNHRPETQVLAEGTLADGVLHGNLVLHGGGDANLDGANPLPYSLQHPLSPPADPLADLDSLAEAVAAKGVRVIDGDVVGDDTAFGDAPYPEGWSTEDLLWGYGAPVSALTLHDNLIDLTVTPTAQSAPAVVTASPSTPYYRINPITNPGDPVFKRTPNVYTSNLRTLLSIERSHGSHDLSVIGDIRPGSPLHEQVAIDDPAAFAALAFRAALERQGITVNGAARPRHASRGDLAPFLSKAGNPDEMQERMVSRSLANGPMHTSCNAQAVAVPGAPETTVIVTHEGPSLADDLVLTLKTSQNLHAELMLRALSVESCMENLPASVQTVRSFLTVAGIDNDAFVFYDGSGLSTKDLVTPRATAQLLAFAGKQTWFAQWFAGLPVGGVDGTLSSRFSDPPLKGHVFAKTGTLGESRALAGYLDARSGRRVVFSILVDNHSPGSSADRAIMDRIVAAIAASE